MVSAPKELTKLKKKKKFDGNAVWTLFQNEYNSISETLKYIQKARGLPSDEPDKTPATLNGSASLKSKKKPVRLFPGLKDGKTPAKSIEELQNKLSELKGKTNLSYKDKLLKKGLKNRIKKKEKKSERKLTKKVKQINKQAEIKPENAETKLNAKQVKPVYNTEGKLVFNKFDFSNLGSEKDEKKKIIKDPKVALAKLKEKQKKLKNLEQEGKKDIAEEIKNKSAWSNALLKSEGLKVKDDVELVKKSLKKIKERKKKSKEKWKAREEKVKKGVKERQKKRDENIQSKQKKNKVTKMKKAVKRGRIVAGF